MFGYISKNIKTKRPKTFRTEAKIKDFIQVKSYMAQSTSTKAAFQSNLSVKGGMVAKNPARDCCFSIVDIISFLSMFFLIENQLVDYSKS